MSVTDRPAGGTPSAVDRTDLAGAHELLVRSRVELAALDRLYHSLAPGLLRWLRARVADPEVATDLLAETFAQVVCSIERYRGEGDESAVAWVWGIARNLLRRYYRRQRVETAARQRLGVTAPEPVTVGPDEAQDASVGAELRAALDGLPAAPGSPCGSASSTTSPTRRSPAAKGARPRPPGSGCPAACDSWPRRWG